MLNWLKKLFNSRKPEPTDNGQRNSCSFKLTNELKSLAQEYKNECEYLKETK